MTKNKFHFTINDGPEQTITMKSGVYVQVVAALPGVLGIDQDAYPLTIKIWVPDLLPEYGPYTYYIDAAGGDVVRFTNDGTIRSWSPTRRLDSLCYFLRAQPWEESGAVRRSPKASNQRGAGHEPRPRHDVDQSASARFS